MKLLKPYKEYIETYWIKPAGTFFGMKDAFSPAIYYRFRKSELLDAFGSEKFHFQDGYSISRNEYSSIEAAKAAGIALAQSYGYIVAETDEEVEKIRLLI